MFSIIILFLISFKQRIKFRLYYHFALVCFVLGNTAQMSESQLQVENGRLREALARSCAHADKWRNQIKMLEEEKQKLLRALEESHSNLDRWKAEYAQNNRVSCSLADSTTKKSFMESKSYPTCLSRSSRTMKEMAAATMPPILCRKWNDFRLYFRTSKSVTEQKNL